MTWAEAVVAYLEGVASHAQVEHAQAVGVAMRSDHQVPRLPYVDRRAAATPAGPPCPACGRATTRREVRQGTSVETLRERVFYECQTAGSRFGSRCGFGWYEDADADAALAAYKQRRKAMLQRAAEGRENKPRRRQTEEGEDMPRGGVPRAVIAERRAQVAEMLRAGKNNVEIISALHTSPDTIAAVRREMAVAVSGAVAAAPIEPRSTPAPQAVGTNAIQDAVGLPRIATALRAMLLGEYLRQSPEVRAAIDVLAGIEVQS